MTEIAALREIADLVERGEWKADNPAKDFPLAIAWASYNGSLDAARALHEAVLPGWRFIFRDTDEEDVERGACEQGEYFANVWRKGGNPNFGAEHFPVFSSNTARAWLLAIIRAKIAELEA